MDEMQQLKKKTILSTISLFALSGYSAVLGLGANLVITILLSPTIYGIYITMLSIISLFNYFSDVGLAASLIQKKEIDDQDLSTTFTVQQSMILTIVIIGFIATPWIMKFYNLATDGTYLYWALLAGFFLSSTKTIPSVLLERTVKFQKIVFVQMAENTVFYGTVIACAILGFGLRSFAIAVLVRSITGVILIYSISFWMPRFGISVPHLKHLLKFGLPFQTSSFLALFKDDLLILYLGKTLGFESLGYIGWAKKWAEAPLRIIMDNVSRVLFPVIARLQHETEKLNKLLERILSYQTLLIAPAVCGIAMSMHYFVFLYAKYHKWIPAMPLLYIFAASALLTSYSSPFTNLFNSLGKAKVTLFFMMCWTAGIWILTIIFNHMFGNAGFPLAQLVLSGSFVFVLREARKFVQFRFIATVIKPLIATTAMGIVFLFIGFLFPTSIVSFGISLVLGPLTFLAILLLLRFDIHSHVRLLIS